MGAKSHEGRTWPFGHGGHGNQNPRLNPRNGASDGGWEGDNGGNQDHNGGNTWTTATNRPAPTAQQTANPTANGPNTTQRQQTNYPTQAPIPGQPTYAQGDNGGQRTQPTQPDRGQPAHTTVSDSTRSMTVVLGETTFATRYTDYDTLAIDTHAPTFSSGPLPTSGAGSYNNNNNLNSASNNQQGGSANGTTNYQSADLDGGLGGGTIAGIIVGVVLVLVISLVALFFHRKRKLARRGNNSPYGKHHPEEASSSLLDNGLAATVGAGAAAVEARSGGGHGHEQAGDASSTVRNTPSASQQQPPSMQQTNNNSQYLVPASSSSSSRTAPYTAPRPAPPPPPSSSHSSNFSLSMITPPPTHISSAFAPGAVSPISTVSPAVMGPPSPLLSDEEKEIGTLGRRPSVESISTFSVHSAMMTASQINWPMPPSVASTSSPSVPLTKTPSRPVPVPAPHYVDFEEQGRTVVRINRESLTGGIGKAR
ncbi:uncharacterized protein B0T23DRAFT_234498 [Neurospora hispaniola]|uniref:Uncharacterized protein n=1 Tax=Neurospora hispaniola TaxID=588809 RepID=A0AAJ0I173_9PEZI|nr:hypothetical protein B0T23DRAFT_234498 [Neurospora hispaniola]